MLNEAVIGINTLHTSLLTSCQGQKCLHLKIKINICFDRHLYVVRMYSKSKTLKKIKQPKHLFLKLDE